MPNLSDFQADQPSFSQYGKPRFQPFMLAGYYSHGKRDKLKGIGLVCAVTWSEFYSQYVLTLKQWDHVFTVLETDAEKVKMPSSEAKLWLHRIT